MFHPLRKDESVSQDVFIPSIINNTFYGNTAINDAGAIRLQCEQQTPVIFNCIFWENEAQMGDDIYNWRPDDVIVSYSDIDVDNIFGPWDGEGNINEDPLFCDDSFHISWLDSPCWNKGINQLENDGIVYYAPDHDFEETPRPCDLIADIGADEDSLYSGITDYKAASIKLHAFPNPTSGISDIRYRISDIRYVLLEVFDMHGQRIRTLLNEKQKPGSYNVPFDGSELPIGIYFIRLTAGNHFASEKLLLFN